MIRGDDDRRHHRERIIRRGSSIVADVFGRQPATWFRARGVGAFDKETLVCSGGPCCRRKPRQDRVVDTCRWQRDPDEQLAERESPMLSQTRSHR